MESYESGCVGGPNDKYSIKNMLFSRAIPIYNLPVPTAGYKVHGCVDCGDKFILESSLKYHIERKSVKITYFCRHCGTPQTFFNRCNMLSHIRSHGFKTATINLTDLKVGPLPYKQTQLTNALLKKNSNTQDHRKSCYDCGIAFYAPDSSAINLKCRALHYEIGSKPIENTCPVCSCVFKTLCSFKVHLRLHLSIPPYYCPDCGIYLGPNVKVPLKHQCPSFEMMRAAARVKCPLPDCSLVHPNEYREHINHNHFRTVYKCNSCYVACFDEKIIKNHIKSSHKFDSAPLSAFYQCQLCPGKLIMQSQITKHLDSHVEASTNAYLCWNCNQYFMSLHSLIVHYAVHDDSIKQIYESLLKTTNQASHKIYRVIKKCEQCKRSFTYKCKYEDIEMLPNECPFKCSFSSGSAESTANSDSQNKNIICFQCKEGIPQNWKNIKEHFNEHHKTIRCVDVIVNIPIINVEKYLKNKNNTAGRKIIKRKGRKSRRKNDRKISNLPDDSINKIKESDALSCKRCGLVTINRELLEIHLLIHRDPCMAYQCMECGECFVVKPSFSKHLLIKHGISNVEDYIFEKKCFNQKALNKHLDEPTVDEPVHENQCKICREQFENSGELEKHFRVHGMAFLMKNNKTNSP